MNFAEILAYMKQGGKVKRPHWGGFWEMQDGTIIIHTKDGEVFDLFDTKMKEYTLDCMAADDFIPAADSNTPILGGVARMDFSHALHLLKKGVPMTREGWNGKGLFVVMQKAYPDGIPCNKQTADAWGMEEGELFKCEPYMQINTVHGSHSMWVPSITDLFAADWVVKKEEER